jgi:hypothetical protein
MFFVRVNQVLVRRWTCLVAMSDRLIPLAFAQEGLPATRSGSRTFGSARARLGHARVACGGVGCERALLCAELRCVARRGGVCSHGSRLDQVWMAPVHGGNDLERKKGIRWMPWHQEAMKDVARCEKPRGAASRR